MVKIHIPAGTFVSCAQQPRPHNSLFGDVSSYDLGYPEMERYLDLLVALFELSPQGALSLKLCMLLYLR